jgi:hypothetical protein
MTRVSLLATAAVAMLAAACAGQQTASTSVGASSISRGTERSHMSAQRDHRSTAPASESAETTAPAQTAQATPPAIPPPAATPATPAAPTTFTDAQLQSFVTASQQIQPLNAQLATATPEQRTALAGQIRGVLQQNNLDGATYNAIATQAQSDQALAARLAALQAPPTNG